MWYGLYEAYYISGKLPALDGWMITHFSEVLELSQHAAVFDRAVVF